MKLNYLKKNKKEKFGTEDENNTLSKYIPLIVIGGFIVLLVVLSPFIRAHLRKIELGY